MPGLSLESDDLGIVKILRDLPPLHLPEHADPLEIAGDVARVFDVRLDRLGDFPRDPLKFLRQVVP